MVMDLVTSVAHITAFTPRTISTAKSQAMRATVATFRIRKCKGSERSTSKEVIKAPDGNISLLVRDMDECAVAKARLGYS
jgi:hypothetical protein